MLLGMPVADLEIRHFLTCGVAVAIGVTESAYRGLTGSVVVGEVIGEIRPTPIASAYASASRLLSSLLVIDLSPFIAAAAADWVVWSMTMIYSIFISLRGS